MKYYHLLLHFDFYWRWSFWKDVRKNFWFRSINEINREHIQLRSARPCYTTILSLIRWQEHFLVCQDYFLISIDKNVFEVIDNSIRDRVAFCYHQNTAQELSDWINTSLGIWSVTEFVQRHEKNKFNGITRRKCKALEQLLKNERSIRLFSVSGVVGSSQKLHLDNSGTVKKRPSLPILNRSSSIFIASHIDIYSCCLEGWYYQ